MPEEPKLYSINIVLDPANPVKPLKIESGDANTVLDEEEIRVHPGEKVKYTSDLGFSLFFPDETVMKDAVSSVHPATGGDVFKPSKTNDKHEVVVEVSKNVTLNRSYEYFITATDGKLVYTDDPEVYVC